MKATLMTADRNRSAALFFQHENLGGPWFPRMGDGTREPCIVPAVREA